WQKEIEDDPTLVGPYLQYSEHLKAHGDLDGAEKLLAKGLKAVPDDPSLQQAHAEVQIGRLGRALAAWTRKAKEAPDNAEARAKVERLGAKLAEYEINEYRRRISLHPGELDLQYELGLRLARAGQHKEAITAFQQARSSPALRAKALHQLGLSFEAE